MEKSILDDVFGKTEEEVETFMDAIKSQVTVPDKYSRMAEDRPDMVSAPELTDQISGSIRIQSGWHGDDFIFHISADPRRGWKVSQERLIYSIAKTMNNVIPQTINVSIFVPMVDWDIQEYTFKVHNLTSCWYITPEVLAELTKSLFSVLKEMA